MSEGSSPADSFQRLHAYFETAADSVFVVRRDGEITLCNDRASSMFGFPKAELIGSKIEIVIPPEVAKTHPAKRSSFFESPSERPMGSGNELRGMRKDGTVFPIDVSLNPVQVNGDTEVVAEVRDLTAQKSLERNVSRYQASFEKSFDSMIIADDSGRYIEVNQSACQMFELEREELLGRRASDFAPEDFDFSAAWGEFQSSDHERGLFPLVTATGQHRLVEYAATTDIVPGEHLSVLRDVTEREERSEQLRVIENVLRHNLRNNMNIILGNASMVRDDIDGEAGALTDNLIETGRSLLKKVDKAQEMTRFLSDPPKREVIDVVEMIERIVAEIRSTHDDVDISVSVPEEAPVYATVLLERGIVELIENAIEFSDRSVPQITIEVSAEESLTTIVVADDGPGIPSMEIDVLTGEKDIQPLFHGSGFGLWLTHLIVKQSKGKLTFAEQHPRGSTVTIELSTTVTAE